MCIRYFPISKTIALLTCLLVITACNAKNLKAADVTLESTQLQNNNNKPNVLFILVDDLGYSDIGAYNHDTFYQTPNIDQLAKEGIQFTNGYAANPVCSPSRYAILTGRHPSRVNATDWFHVNGWPHRVENFNPADLLEKMPLQEKTMAETFSDNGYNTAFLGKWHLGEEEEYWPENHGFDINVGGMKHGQPPNGYFSPYKNPRLSDGPEGEYLTDRLTDEAIGLIDDFSKQKKPFFMYMSFYTVHTPLQAPKETVDKYEELVQNIDANDEFSIEEQIWPTDEKRLVRVKQNHATYAAMVHKMDSNVGRILNKLKLAGIDDNTIVVFTSDNGGLSTAEGSPTSNLPLRGGKGWLYEGGIRVPFIIKMPNALANGSKVNTPVVATDFYPTLLRLTDIPLVFEQHIDGVSLLPILNGNGIDQDRALYFHYPHYSNQGGFPGAAIRLGDWKLIERFEDGKIHLYNLKNDISEKKDLSKENSEKTDELQEKLHQWYKEVDANFLKEKEGNSPWKPAILTNK